MGCSFVAAAQDGVGSAVDSTASAAGSLLNGAADAVQGAVSATGDAVKSAGDAVGDAVKSAGDAVGDFASTPLGKAAIIAAAAYASGGTSLAADGTAMTAEEAAAAAEAGSATTAGATADGLTAAEATTAGAGEAGAADATAAELSPVVDGGTAAAGSTATSAVAPVEASTAAATAGNSLLTGSSLADMGKSLLSAANVLGAVKLAGSLLTPQAPLNQTATPTSAPEPVRTQVAQSSGNAMQDLMVGAGQAGGSAGVAQTLLTGANGVDTKSLSLDKRTLLGS
jgi:hypothetical protein